MEMFLYIAWIIFIIVGLVIRYQKRKAFRQSHTIHHPLMDKATFDSLDNRVKSRLFDAGELISHEQNGTSSRMLKKVNALLVERILLNGKLNGFMVHDSMEAFEASRPTSNPIDVEQMEEEYYRWLSKQATQEDLINIFGEPKPLTEEEKKKQDEELKSRHYIDENEDDLPF